MKIWLAPLHGITNYHFRKCLNRHAQAIDVAISPFLPVQSAEKLRLTKLVNNKLWKDIAPENNVRKHEDVNMIDRECERVGGNQVLIPQLMGNKAADFVNTITILVKWNYYDFNWNIGCPAAQVVSRRRGCGIMPYLDMVEEVVAAVTAIDGVHFSLKMRLGLKQCDEGEDIIKRLNHYNLAFIVIHPRLGVQQYEGKPDWEQMERLLSLTRHEVVYSGDVNSVADYKQWQYRFPQLTQLMLGRGLLANPFLAEEIKQGAPLPLKEWKQRFVNYYTDLSATLLRHRGEKGALGNLKELWQYFAKTMQLSDMELIKLLRINQYHEFITTTKALIFS